MKKFCTFKLYQTTGAEVFDRFMSTCFFHKATDRELGVFSAANCRRSHFAEGAYTHSLFWERSPLYSDFRENSRHSIFRYKKNYYVISAFVEGA